MSSNTNIGNTPVNQGYVQLIHTGETGGIDGTLRTLYDGDGTASDLQIASNKVKISTELYIGSKTITEYVQDVVGDMFDTNGSHTNITATYDDDGDGAIDLSSSGEVTLTGTETLTNKTLASPTLTGTTNGVNITLSGDLTVNGTTTTVNQTNLDVSDNIIGLNRGASSNANDSGLIIERGSTGDNVFIGWDESADRVVFGVTSATPDSTGDLTIVNQPIQAARLFGDVTGDVTGSASLNLLISSNLSDLNNASTARTNLGLGTIATQASSSVSITGGSITGITDLAIADGGTGASNAGNARINLGLGTLAELNSIQVADFLASAITTSAEAFADNDTTVMTSAAINDRIESFGYDVGDMTGVNITASNPLDISQSNTTSGDYTATISLDASEFGSYLTDMTDNALDVNELAILDSGTLKRKAINEIRLSLFDDTGFSAGAVSSVANGADNRIATFSSSDALNGESNLTFDGSALSVTGTANVTSTLSTDYGVRFNNGNTDFMFYNNTGDNLLYLRDLTNAQMLQTWTTSSTTIHKNLSVSGNVNATGDINVSDDVIINVNANYIYSRDASGTLTRMFGMNSSNNTYIGPIDSYAGGSILYGASSNVADQIFYTSGSERLRIKATTGNVGIGDTNPPNKLSVKGSSTDLLYLEGDGITSTSIIASDTGGSTRTRSAGGTWQVYTGGSAGSNSASGATFAMEVDSSQRVGINTSSPAEKLDVNGNIRIGGGGGLFAEHSSASLGGTVIHPNGGTYRTSSNAFTGAIKITLPTGTGTIADMISFWVDIFDYAADESFTCYIAGYAYQTAGSNEWVNEEALMLSANQNRDFTVRFGHDGSNHCVYIGELTSSWNYPQITIRNVQIGFSSDVDTYNDGWSISFESSAFQNVDETQTDNFPYAKGLKSSSNMGAYIDGNEKFRFTTGGAFHASNDVVAFSTTPSDIKLKTNVEDINYGLDTIMKLKPKQYDWKKDNRKDIGFIAQEVEEVIPEIVKDNEWFDDKIKTMDYEKLTAVLIKAVQEQQKQIEELKNG